MAYYKITIHLVNGRKLQGIRKYDAEAPQTLRMRIWDKAGEAMAKREIDRIDITKLDPSDPEVTSQWLKEMGDF